MSYLACIEVFKKVYLGCLGLCSRNQFNGMILLVVVRLANLGPKFLLIILFILFLIYFLFSILESRVRIRVMS